MALRIFTSCAAFAVLLWGVACESPPPEEPDSEQTVGEEIEGDVDEAAQDTEDAVDEAEDEMDEEF